MHSIRIIIISLFSLSIYAKTLPEIQTKQSLNNIRFLSNDGKFTYFQQNGKLYLSTNYSSAEILEKENSSYFLLSGSESRKKIIIEEIPNFHRELNYRKKNIIYTMDFGKTTPIKVTEGTFLSLNLQDSWLNSYDPQEKAIEAKNLNNSKTVSVKLKNKLNPYFIPQALMRTQDTIFYTDINDNGFMGLLMYSFYDKKFTSVYKSKFKAMNLKFCQSGDNLYVGEFSYNGISNGSAIFKIPFFNNPGFSNIEQIYSSDLNDIGNLLCSKQSLYFIKTLSEDKQLNTKKSEVARLDLKSKKITIITDLNYVTNIINMDGNILIPFRDKYYVAEGKSKLNDDKLNNN